MPGVNITQVSARDINVTARGATSTLATGQLALLDGRSLYQDFFGFVMWDFLPVNLNEIKQVEVISGPASAVWGANALNGVVNVITKSPREMQGTAFTMGVGGFDRSTNDSAAERGDGLLHQRHARAGGQRSRGVTSCRPAATRRIAMPRPTGTIPCDMPEVCTRDATNPYPPFNNQGTTQPKFDARVDYDYANGAKLVVLGRRRRHRRHHAHRHRAVRHQQRLGDGLRQGELHEQGLQGRLLHQHPQRRRRRTC